MVTVAKGVKAPIKLMFPRVGKGMIFNESNVGMVPSERTAIDLATLSDGGDDNVMIGKYNSSELLGCKLICIHDEHCIGMEWNVDSPSCLLFSNAVGSLVAASSGAAVQWFVTGDKFMPSMLGLGDIVVPGIFLSLLAKFDVTQAAAQKKNESGGGGTYWNYFNVAMFAYVLSLVVTLAAMIIWEAAQPALLYIVPFLIITSGIMAWLKGDLTQLDGWHGGSTLQRGPPDGPQEVTRKCTWSTVDHTVHVDHTATPSDPAWTARVRAVALLYRVSFSKPPNTQPPLSGLVETRV